MKILAFVVRVECPTCEGRKKLRLRADDRNGETGDCALCRGLGHVEGTVSFEAFEPTTLERLTSDTAPGERVGRMGKSDDPKYSSTRGVTPGFENETAPGPKRADGQHESYWVLSTEERANGFVRPVRSAYFHARGRACGTKTTMGRTLAETYAREPGFYTATFCYGCHEHFPVAEFDWGSGGVVGS